eukprot:TRINITY_DN2263_c0_g1_i1.p1 TRINITY_DN2263_c0_g1~~TRINITY_DN2263_c0_g1_i1.p1  ORF type:complete len:367 (-),score=140.23 TRINITY_DN2263_c0_g1_i1:153-1253(-)
MAKVNSPTANIFALLADVDQPQKKTKAAAKGAANELTPKERAEAKAVQEAEAKAKKEAALKAKQAQEAARKAKAAEGPVDDTGFTQQRHQRIKESRTAPVEAPKAKGKKGPKANKEERVKSDNTEFVKSDKTENKVAKGEKSYNKPNRGREFDKQSQGVQSRKPAAKKGGHGRGNWDKPADAVAPGTTVESATTPAATADAEWVDAPDATPVVEGEEVATEAAAEVAAEEYVEEEEVDNSVSYADYLAAQAEKAKELGAQYSRAQPRALTPEETAALAKFTLVENNKGPVKKAKEAKETKAVPAKKQVVTVETNFAYPPRDGGDARPQRGGRRGKNQNQGDKKKNAARPAKLPKGGNFDAQFPTLA